MLGRRDLLLGAVGGLFGSLAWSRRGAAQPAGIVPLNDRLSLVTSGRTNVLALSTADGLIVADSGAPESSDRLMDSLRQLAPGGRVGTVFNTHWHAENTGANDVLSQGGATIVAHEHTRLWMATPIWVPEEDRYRPPRSKTALPTKTFYAEASMQTAGERIDYGYLIEAHTSGDIFVFFRDSNVLAVGDVASPARDPELDAFTGAWIGGRVDALSRLLDLSNDATRIVPGFGGVMSRADLQAERVITMKTIYDRAVDEGAQGRQRPGSVQGGCPERPRAGVEGSVQVPLLPSTKACGRTTTSLIAKCRVNDLSQHSC